MNLSTDTRRQISSLVVSGRWTIPALCTFALLTAASSLLAVNGLCAGKDSTLRCLKDNFSELYMADNARFFEILRAAEGKARRCNSLPNTVEYLEIARFVRGNAEVREYFSEVVERFCTTKPRCFLKALSQVDHESQGLIIDGLRTPMFLEENAIREVFLRHKRDSGYKSIMDLYFKPH